MGNIRKIGIVGAGSVGSVAARELIRKSHEVVAIGINNTDSDTHVTLTLGGKQITLPKDQVKDAIKFIMEADSIKLAMDRKEADCLKRIHARYCMLNGWPINDFDVCKVLPEEKVKLRPSYVEYWYMFGTPAQFFLMSREIKIVDGAPVLDVVFSSELMREGE